MGKGKRAVRQNNGKERENLLSRWGGGEEDGGGGTAFKLEGGKEKTGEECENVDFFSSLTPSLPRLSLLSTASPRGGRATNLPAFKATVFRGAEKRGAQTAAVAKVQKLHGGGFN